MADSPNGSDTRPIINFRADRVAFGPRMADHNAAYLRWRNDFSLTWSDAPGTLRPIPFDQVAHEFEEAAAGERRSRLQFTVYGTDSWEPIGCAELLGVDLGNRNAFLSVRLPEAAADDLRVEAIRLAMDYAFTVTGIHSLAAVVPEYNESLLAQYEGAGFRHFARRRASILRSGRLWDTIYLDALSTEFTSPWLGRVLMPDVPREGGA
jgi:diamine N-acetyltransferase